jgi:hypothetical protein
MITQAELKEVLEYNPDTGVFIRVKSNSPSVKVGDVAGTYDYKGYIAIKINYKLYKAHRLAWLYMRGKFPEKCIDHINHIKDDNRWTNLREATNSQNNSNRVKQKNNKSGYKGVIWKKKNKKWQATITYMNKIIYLGLYTTPEEASEAYKKKAIELFGEFSYTE